MSTPNPGAGIQRAVGPGDASAAPVRWDWRTRFPFFYGWVIVAGCFVTLAITYGVYYSFSIFYVALLEEFGWGRAESAGVFSLFVVIMGLAGAVSGTLADRLGPGRVMAVGATVLAAGLAACSRVADIWQFYLSFGLVAAIGMGSSSWALSMLIMSRWFSARLGTALGIASAGIGSGIVVMVPLSQLLISALGWRSAYLTLAAIVFVGVIPTALLILRGRPQDLGLLQDGRRSPSEIEAALKGASAAYQSRVVDRQWAGRDWTVPLALQTRRYWSLFLLTALGNVSTQMIFVHQAAFLVDGGFDKLVAASVIGLIGLLSMGTKIGWGWTSDRLGRESAFTVGDVFLMTSVGLLIMTRLVSFPPMVYLYALSFALGYAVTTVITPAAAGDVFSGRHFGSIYGTLSIASGLGSASGAWFAGFVFDVTGSYLFAFGCSAVSSLLCVAAIWIASPRKVRRARGRD